MTKNEARHALVMLSYGTLATLTGVREFDKLDDILSIKLETLENTLRNRVLKVARGLGEIGLRRGACE